MAKKRIASILMCMFFTTPLAGIKEMQIPSSKPEQLTESDRNLNLRNYKIEQVEEFIEAEIQKRKEIELAEQERQKEIKKQEELEEQNTKEINNRIYCKFEVSFYTTAPDEGSGTGIGASGEYVQPWVSIALPSDIPFYSTATIEGLGTFVNLDTGSYIQWAYDNEGDLVCRVDVCVNSKEEAYSLGRYYADGYIDIKE